MRQHGEVLCSHQGFIKIHRMVDFFVAVFGQGANPNDDRGIKFRHPLKICLHFQKTVYNLTLKV